MGTVKVVGQDYPTVVSQDGQRTLLGLRRTGACWEGGRIGERGRTTIEGFETQLI